MLSPEASEMIANIGTLTLDQVRGFLPVAKSKTQEYVDLIAKARTSSRQSEEKVRSTIAMYDFFPPECRRQNQHLINSMMGTLDKMNAAREEGEKEVNELIEECITIEKACIKRGFDGEGKDCNKYLRIILWHKEVNIHHFLHLIKFQKSIQF
ncbi:uncharacterized protein EAE97_002270 [Botrytis byssoidea]|uniref:Uncharacterized protein n=1 Tax=Botrytis byssoidea TaxID=139641 RepID=A0A9P5M563_9HELO|nr:uncharacterized protein EAE97_002270 [Botrytis byssoidea]KAF7950718.1 hypothetical protein EAE97_002270 [Botrytis byssoidea]